MNILEIWTTAQVLWERLPDLVGATVGLLGVLITVALLIPGNEPEGTLRRVSEWISKYSRKQK